MNFKYFAKTAIMEKLGDDAFEFSPDFDEGVQIPLRNFDPFATNQVDKIIEYLNAQPIKTIGVTRMGAMALDEKFLSLLSDFDIGVYMNYDRSLMDIEVEQYKKLENTLKKNGRHLFAIDPVAGTIYDINRAILADKILTAFVKQCYTECDLSPLERYMYCYNITTNFTEYKMEPDGMNASVSRCLTMVLTGNEDYMCCVAYSYLLKALCERSGIPCMVNEEYVGRIKKDEIHNPNHIACRVFIDDPKYKVKGIFHACPTGDNLGIFEEGRLLRSLSTKAVLRNRDREEKVFSISYETDLLNSDDFYDLGDELMANPENRNFYGFLCDCKAIPDELVSKKELREVVLEKMREKIVDTLKHRKETNFMIDNNSSMSDLIRQINSFGTPAFDLTGDGLLRRILIHPEMLSVIYANCKKSPMVGAVKSKMEKVRLGQIAKSFWIENTKHQVVSLDKIKRAFMAGMNVLTQDRDDTINSCAEVFALTAIEQLNSVMEYAIEKSKYDFDDNKAKIPNYFMFEKTWAQEILDSDGKPMLKKDKNGKVKFGSDCPLADYDKIYDDQKRRAQKLFKEEKSNELDG